MELTDSAILAEGRRVFEIERTAVLAIENSLGQPFVDAVRLILRTKGNVIFSGVGKSGHVARSSRPPLPPPAPPLTSSMPTRRRMETWA